MVDPPSHYTRSRAMRQLQSHSHSRSRRLLLAALYPVHWLVLRMRPLPRAPDSRSSRRERGSATVWAVSVLLLVSAAVGCALIWVAVEGTRHSTERAADSAALAAASAALRRLAMQDDSDPCAAASKAAGQAGAELVRCECVPLDCTVTVRRSMPFLGPLATGLTGQGSVEATSRAGPVGESAGDGSA
jgi:secretion/DNA translocation related TadE-like protein